eukprot:TRINITY_DN9549_c0_g1_i1.p1 TRINITY_DN9549_c0_g1~~TRINITY_DN9549_c0_g1_i1.p1  ORF type:complete len:251 (-),score=36.25 TRINITY_DN9549_c0_g1_i1:34-786(-)
MSLRVLCQNVNMHHLVSHAKNQDARTQNFLTALQQGNYDIVMIQEMFVLNTLGGAWGADIRARIIAKGTELGLAHSAVTKPANKLFGQDAGLLILSRFPIKRQYSVPFREWGWKECTNKKGLLHAVLEMPNGKEVNVITTHMDAHEKVVRDAQVKQLRLHLQGHCSTDAYNIIGGGFNVTAGGPEFKQLRNFLHPMKDGWTEQHPPTHNNVCVDYMFFTPNIRVEALEVVRADDFSDHNGVAASFHLIEE